MSVEDCAFCAIPLDQAVDREGPCLAIWTHEPPAGSAMVVPIEHRADVWELTPAEWAATRELLARVRRRVEHLHNPDGWSVGWNVGPVGGQTIGHAHCHLLPRHADEPYAGRGIRWWIKSPENRRPPAGGTT